MSGYLAHMKSTNARTFGAARRLDVCKTQSSGSTPDTVPHWTSSPLASWFHAMDCGMRAAPPPAIAASRIIRNEENRSFGMGSRTKCPPLSFQLVGSKLETTMLGTDLIAPGVGIGIPGAATTTSRSLAKQRPTKLLSGLGLIRMATSNCSSTRSTTRSSATTSIMTSG
ncbi:hypothetical protein PS922_00983 [Pseudomonas fluorescens]|uniref:Uncharacterized protein n=1 Tax=Pseudomonas fluorescens TaxID=294 RepID=A0A5E7RGD3_PSEFL|nr:hypothetical protein PS922_00983 [Pseudomonas fluorescens]